MNTNNEHTLENALDKSIIYDITPFTLIDFPQKMACILWFAGCNMRCQYCYNPDIVFGKGNITGEQALSFIKSRKGLLDGVVFSGGECTLHKEIIELAHAIKKIGLLVKIDTNGSHPARLKACIEQHLVDYVSLDFKALPDKFEPITQSTLFHQFEESLLLLQKSSIGFEVRTTVHSELLSNNDLAAMHAYLERMDFQGTFFIQNFLADTDTIGAIGKSHIKVDVSEYSHGKIEIVIRNE